MLGPTSGQHWRHNFLPMKTACVPALVPLLVDDDSLQHIDIHIQDILSALDGMKVNRTEGLDNFTWEQWKKQKLGGYALDFSFK